MVAASGILSWDDYDLWGLSLYISRRGRAIEFDGLVIIRGRVDGRATGDSCFWETSVVAC